jgi:K+-sensing histidine kinase KdpD
MGVLIGRESRRERRLRLVNAAIGFTVTGVAASVLALLFWNSRFYILATVIFTLVVVAVAMHFGRVVGILGTLLGAAIFAIWLYPPLGSLHVNSQQARSSLNALLLGGLVLSYLLGEV